MFWMKYLAYLMATIFIILGAAFLAGYFIPISFPLKFRIILGVVFILYGTFRIVITYFKNNNRNES
ncbi:MAG: hypothetical protein ACYC6P_00905 [Ignavibacteriaceae bacterium]